MDPKAGRPSLDPAQAERVAELLEQLLREKYDQNKTSLAKALNISQAAVSQLLSRKNRASFQTAMKVGELTGRPLSAVIGTNVGGFGETIPNGLRDFLATQPKSAFSAEEIQQAATFRSLDGVDLAPEQWGRYLKTQRALRATFDAEERLREQGVDPALVQPKADLRVVHDDPIEEAKAARKAKRGAK